MEQTMIRVQTPVGPQEVRMFEKERKATEAERALKAALRKAVSLGTHTYSIAQLMGIYPA